MFFGVFAFSCFTYGMNVHNRSKKEVCAVRNSDDALGFYRSRNAAMAMRFLSSIGVLETIGYRPTQ